ncbi:polysaccharide deacetylase family protein [Cytobacillus purgationiresistens]|uniref:Peptidoglycan/xylan/chitin deacetylase (PgdA/CDA1 family) n=1 Tax=Cytobacillus purgationiresistens TaxID=863449 RepID=A0ABU0AMF1_9BACI|nr:polysaccharide deacetylase family protein [Cytobacillus purgationiresistens]MDQ0272438.1 peptidoglycan/xylan/chitin deacetylase (PgdA/CDA1 family) [Cytobacillus purgationiresistens]
MIKSYGIILLSVFLLLGCNSTSTKEKTDASPVISTPKEEKPEEVEDDSSDAEKKEMEDVINERVEPQYEVNEATWKLEPLGEANEKIVLLTIDDAPDQHAIEMAQTLNNLAVKAIFFVNGHFLDSKKGEDALKKIHEMGFAIGNHTYHHENLKEISVEEQKEEINRLNDRIEEIIGERPKFFRAPFGANTDESLQIVKDAGMTAMNWTYGYDWEKEYQTKDALANIMIESPFLSNGSILLMHDRTWTNEALETIVNGLIEKGYEIADPALIKTP